jgi:hypothetical protein
MPDLVPDRGFEVIHRKSSRSQRWTRRDQGR